MKFKKLLFIPAAVFFVSIADFLCQPRFFQNPSSDHNLFRTGKSLHNFLIIIFAYNIPIITKRVPAAFLCFFKGLPVNGILLILICFQPGMYDKLLQRIFFKNFQKLRPLLLILHSNSCFYGNSHWTGLKNFFQKAVQFPGKRQKTGASVS